MISQQQIDEAVRRLKDGLVIDDSDRVGNKYLLTIVELHTSDRFPNTQVEMIIRFDGSHSYFFGSPETAEQIILYLQDWLDYRHYLKDEN